MGIKYSVNESFFEVWSSQSAYVLGYLYADGSLENSRSIRGLYTRISSTNKDQIYKIKGLLGSEHNIVVEEPTGLNRKVKYKLRIGNGMLYRSLVNLGLSERKSLTMRFPEVPNSYFSDFIRGYFDGDGGVYLQTGKGALGQEVVRRLLVVFTSGSRSFLLELCTRLNTRLGLRSSKIYDSHRSFQLRYGTADSIVLYKFLYGGCEDGLYLSRKLHVFEKYFKLRPAKLGLVGE